jgi:LysR family transcriptional regulator, carnitine catabolism transcriptional activator
MEFTSRQLRAFQLVAQHRSFTRAAEALFITVSGLSVLIRELEKQLGFRLFDRTTRQVVLTEFGNDLLTVTRRTLPELDAAMSRIGRTAEGGSQSISVGTTPLIAANILPQAIREFRGQRPDLRIELFDADLTTLLPRLEAGKLDMALGIFWFKNVPGFRRTALFRFSLMAIRADKIGAPHRASTAWSALNGQTLISMAPTNPYQQIINKHLAKTGAICQRGAVVNLLDTQIALVEADEGIAIIPSFGVPVCRNRKVLMSRLINPIVNLEFSQISTRARKLPPGADEFSAFLKTYVARWAGHAGVLY